MADAQAPIFGKVDQPSVPGASSISDNAPPKDPVESLGVKPSDEKPAEKPAELAQAQAQTAPAVVDPTPSKPEVPAAETAPVGFTDAQPKPAAESFEPLKPKDPVAEAAPVQPAGGAEPKPLPEVTGALQGESKPSVPEQAEQTNVLAPTEPAKSEPLKESIPPVEKPAETKPVETNPVENKPVENKPVEDKPVESTKPEPTLNGGSKDIEMKDAVAPAENVNAPAPDTTEKPSIPAAPTEQPAAPAERLAAPPAAPPAADKRKAETNGDEPKGKKQKTGIAGAVESAVESAKEKVSKATNGPSRKDSKKGKRDPAPVGKTLRKTRSQGPVET